MSACGHALRDEFDEKHELWRCCNCGAIGKGDDVMFFATESGPEPSRMQLEALIEALKAERDKYKWMAEHDAIDRYDFDLDDSVVEIFGRSETTIADLERRWSEK